MVQHTRPQGSIIFNGIRGIRPHPVCCGTLQGTSASKGKATGVARVVKSPAGVVSFRPGEVLVVPDSSPAWISLLRNAAAVVTGRGGALSSLAIIAREYSVPVVVGAGDVADLVPDGSYAEVDATAGTIRWRMDGHTH